MELTVSEFKTSIFDYDTEEFKNSKPVMVDLFTDWCPTCKVLNKPLDILANKYKTMDIIKVNITEADALASALDIRGVPTFLFFKPGNNKPIKTLVGGTSVSIENAIKEFVQGENKNE